VAGKKPKLSTEPLKGLGSQLTSYLARGGRNSRRRVLHVEEFDGTFPATAGSSSER
jgi:hypothetical protein